MGGSAPPPPPPPPAPPAPRTVEIPEPPKLKDDGSDGEGLGEKKKGRASLRIKRTTGVNVAGNGTDTAAGVNVPT